MARSKIVIERKKLAQLYYKDGLSAIKIGKIFNCTYSTVINRLREYQMPLKLPGDARMRYPKKDFRGSSTLKAYMTGFRIGDLHAYQESPLSQTVIVRSHTTQEAQLNIVRDLFAPFGHLKIYKILPNHLYASAYLNMSFGFLLPKTFASWQWLRDEKARAQWAFIAGYVDAEGNFIINQGRARFKIDSYDHELLGWMAKWLAAQDIKSRLRCIAKKGEMSYQGYRWKSDLWRLNLNTGRDIAHFLKGIKPFLRHQKRISDALICMSNLKQRKANGSIAY